MTKTRTVLLRIYGPSSGNLISRPHELHTLHVLSSKYHIGPRVYGTFENGRVEEYFDSTALTASDLRDPEISSWIGARMAELHGVDIDAVVCDAEPTDASEREDELAAFKNAKSWLASAREVLALPAAPAEVRGSLDLNQFEREWDLYSQWLHQKEKSESASRRVFSHNDAQYGNLLRLRTIKPGLPSHRQVSRIFSTRPAKQLAEWTRPPSLLASCLSLSRPTPLSHARATLNRVPKTLAATDHRCRFRVRVSQPCRVRHREPLPRVDRELPRRDSPPPRPLALPVPGRAPQLLPRVPHAHRLPPRRARVRTRARGSARPLRGRTRVRDGDAGRPRAPLEPRVARHVGRLGHRAGARDCGAGREGRRRGRGARVRLPRIRAVPHDGLPPRVARAGHPRLGPGAGAVGCAPVTREGDGSAKFSGAPGLSGEGLRHPPRVQRSLLEREC